MKRLIFFVLLIGFGRLGFGQNDTVQGDVNIFLANRVYGQLSQNINTGFLLNRLVSDSNNLVNMYVQKNRDSILNSDIFYGLMYELKVMALDSSSVPSINEIFNEVSILSAQKEFNEYQNIYPIGVVDYEVDYLNEPAAINNRAVNLIDGQFTDGISDTSIYTKRSIQLVCPLKDYFLTDSMGFIFRKDNFYSNQRSTDDVNWFELVYGADTFILKFDDPLFVKVQDSLKMDFQLRVIYKNQQGSFSNKVSVDSKGLGQQKSRKSWTDENCWHVGSFGNSQGHVLEFCYIRGCGNNGAGYRPRKPYILVTGYRPPFIAQSFETTWQYYNDEHDLLLEHLKNNGYDIFLVRFNIHATPKTHGMKESADLFIDFLSNLNANKDGRHENIIQGSSMGSDIVRLALLKMEKKHFEESNYPNHHSRLFISYDGNIFGANIPLSYQQQIYSGYLNPDIGLGTITGTTQFLYATMNQKTVKELLMYHALATPAFKPDQNIFTCNIVPEMHQERLNYYQALENNQSTYIKPNWIFPMQKGTRNVAISLGRYKGTNDEQTDFNVKEAGFYWRNVDLIFSKSKLRAAKYETDKTLLYRRFKTLPTQSIFGIPIPIPTGLYLDHVVYVRNMQEIDSAPGSVLTGAGNMIAVADFSFFPLHFAVNQIGNLFGGEYRTFTHKSTFTALGINPNLWPSNRTHTLNLQNLGLMYSTFDNLLNSDPSEYFGYPNLGRPNDHFQVTPFEAIFCGIDIQPHIRLKDAEDVYVQALNNFILDEVEPWYLGLQNQRLGSQAKSNYIYKSERRAKHHITVGRLVTPTTDPGDYIVEANADLNLRAGDRIHFKPGTHIKAGAKVHAKIEYWPCHRKIEGVTLPGGDEGGMIQAPENLKDDFGTLAFTDSLKSDGFGIQYNKNLHDSFFIQTALADPFDRKPKNPEDGFKYLTLLAIREDYLIQLIREL